jgi:PAS domain S-box-containing protein
LGLTLIEGIDNAIPARLFWKDENLLYLGCNTVLARDAGFADPRDIIGKDDYQMPWRDQAELYRADDRSVIASGRPRLLIEEPQTTPSGDTIWLLTNKVPLRDSTGEIRGMLGTYLDVTEQKRAQAERRELEKQLLEKQKLASVGTLARGMAHEINNPIMGIANYAQLIKDRAAGNSELAEFADEILVEGKRVALMTHGLLSFTQRQNEQPFAPAGMVDIAASTLASVAETARQRGIDLSTDIPTDLPTVSCRQRQMGEVVAALLANAMEAWEGGARGPASPEAMQGMRVDGEPKAIRLTAERLGKDGQAWVRLTVEDNGPVIPAGIRGRVFDPFFTTKDRTRHSGLGLWVSLSIVHDHDGEMTLESEPGSWTRFHIDLPVERPRPA